MTAGPAVGGAEVLPAAEVGADLDALVALGNRFVGSPGERAARAWAGDAMRAAGLADVREEPLELVGYEPVAAGCRVVGEADGLRCVGLQYSACAAVEGEAVYAGRPADADELAAFAERCGGFAGKVVVLRTPWPFLFAQQAAAAGAAALVFVADCDDGAIPHAIARSYPGEDPAAPAERLLSVPGVTVARDDGERLLARMSVERVRLRVEHAARHPRVRTANVVGVVRGTELPEEQVVLCAHYDSQLEGAGAWDNATGVAALLAAARSWAARPTRRTAVFAALAGEEVGIAGAVAYCHRHAGELEAMRAMINFDAVAWAFPAGRCLHVDAALRPLAVARLSEAGWPPQLVVDASLSPGADHNPFIDAGVPAAWPWRYPPLHPGYHTELDGRELVSAEAVAETAAAALHLARCVATEDCDPGRSRPSRRWLDLRPGAGRDVLHPDRDPTRRSERKRAS